MSQSNLLHEVQGNLTNRVGSALPGEAEVEISDRSRLISVSQSWRAQGLLLPEGVERLDAAWLAACLPEAAIGPGSWFQTGCAAASRILRMSQINRLQSQAQSHGNTATTRVGAGLHPLMPSRALLS